MSLDAVRQHLAKFGIGNKIIELPTSSATVDLAALALHTKAERIAKTLSFRTKEHIILIVCAGDMKIDNRKYKDFFHDKAKMLTPEEVLEHTGHLIGGVCPFGLTNSEIRVFTDVSLRRFSSVFPACGSANSAIELSPEDLFQYSGAESWIDVCNSIHQPSTDHFPSS